MNIDTGYWLYQQKLPHHICDDIIKYGLSQKESIAWVGEEKSQPDKKNKKEHTEVVFAISPAGDRMLLISSSPMPS